MKKKFGLCTLIMMASCSMLSANDPYESFNKLPSSNSEATGTSPYDSFSELPGGLEDRRPTLQNEYSATGNQG